MAAKEGLKVALKEELRAGVNRHMLAIKCSFKAVSYTHLTLPTILRV